MLFNAAVTAILSIQNGLTRSLHCVEVFSGAGRIAACAKAVGFCSQTFERRDRVWEDGPKPQTHCQIIAGTCSPCLSTAICQGQDWKLGHLSFCVPALWHLRTSLLGLLYLLHILCCLDRGSRQGPRPYTNLCMRPRERLRSASCLQDAQLILRWEPRTTGHRCLRDA